MIRFPEVPAPDVTVVVVTFNRWDLTSQGLSLLAELTGPRYEVVIVDNASTDGTAAELDRVAGASILRNPRNLGFGPACNQGAAMARGRHLVFLNSDAWVRPGWLDPLVDVAEADPAVAAVASRLLYPTGDSRRPGPSSGAMRGFATTATVTSPPDPSICSAARWTTPRPPACS